MHPLRLRREQVVHAAVPTKPLAGPPHRREAWHADRLVLRLVHQSVTADAGERRPVEDAAPAVAGRAAEPAAKALPDRLAGPAPRYLRSDGPPLGLAAIPDAVVEGKRVRAEAVADAAVNGPAARPLEPLVEAHMLLRGRASGRGPRGEPVGDATFYGTWHIRLLANGLPSHHGRIQLRREPGMIVIEIGFGRTLSRKEEPFIPAAMRQPAPQAVRQYGRGHNVDRPLHLPSSRRRSVCSCSSFVFKTMVPSISSRPRALLIACDAAPYPVGRSRRPFPAINGTSSGSTFTDRKAACDTVYSSASAGSRSIRIAPLNHSPFHPPRLRLSQNRYSSHSRSRSNLGRFADPHARSPIGQPHPLVPMFPRA